MTFKKAVERYLPASRLVALGIRNLCLAQSCTYATGMSLRYLISVCLLQMVLSRHLLEKEAVVAGTVVLTATSQRPAAAVLILPGIAHRGLATRRLLLKIAGDVANAAAERTTTSRWSTAAVLIFSRLGKVLMKLGKPAQRRVPPWPRRLHHKGLEGDEELI